MVKRVKSRILGGWRVTFTNGKSITVRPTDQLMVSHGRWIASTPY
jgi:hypothetical protein